MTRLLDPTYSRISPDVPMPQCQAAKGIWLFGTPSLNRIRCSHRRVDP